MADKIKNVTDSIKSRLSFDNYKASTLPNDAMPESHKDINTEKPKDLKPESHNSVMDARHTDIIRSKKVKRTFYILEEIADRLDEFYAKRLSEKKKVDKSDIVTQAIKDLLQDGNVEVNTF